MSDWQDGIAKELKAENARMHDIRWIREIFFWVVLGDRPPMEGHRAMEEINRITGKEQE